MAEENLRKIQTGSEKSEVCSFSTKHTLKIQGDISYVSLPKAFTRCQQYLETCFEDSTLKVGLIMAL
jgi:hypothetical protein